MSTAVLEHAGVDESVTGHDIIDGVLVERKMSIDSAETAFQLSVRMELAAQATQSGRVYPADAGYEIFPEPHSLKYADVSFFRRERLPREERRRTFFRIPPDIAVEVVSPSDRAYDVEAKARAWIEAGVQVAWVIFPETHTVHVYRRDGRNEMLTADDVLSGDDILQGLELPVRSLFAHQDA